MNSLTGMPLIAPTAPEKVTKSLTTAPLAMSVTMMLVLPAPTVWNGLSAIGLVVSRIGVMSTRLLP